MEKKPIYHLLSFSLLFILISCVNTEQNEIIETDYNLLDPETTEGITISESQEQMMHFFAKVQENTVGKSIPDITVFSLTGTPLNLKNIINSKTILISADAYCAWGQEGISNDFPKTITHIKNDYKEFDYEIICLLKREASDIENPQQFNLLINEVKKSYKSLYVIDESESRKLNLFANPVRLYINEDKVVTYIGIGTSLIEEALYYEIYENTVANN